MVIDNMLETEKTLEKQKYVDDPHSMKEGMSYGSHSTKIFKHFKVDFLSFGSEKVKSTQIVQKESLKNMKIYKTTNRLCILALHT